MQTRIRFSIAIFVVASGIVFAPVRAQAACAPAHAGGEWRSFGHDLSNTRTQSEESTIGPMEAATLEPAWVFSAAKAGDASGSLQSSVAIADGCVYFGTTSGNIFALNADTGQQVWHSKLQVANGNGGTIVGGVTVSDGRVYAVVNQADDPSAAAFDQATGELLWLTSANVKGSGMRTNSSTVVFDGLVLAGFSGPEQTWASGGFAIFDAGSGELLASTYTIPSADRALGYGGGGIWATAVVDQVGKYAFAGTSNPYSKTKEHRFANAILKIDLDRTRPTFGTIVDAYKGLTDQYVPGTDRQPACEMFGETTYLSYSITCAQVDLDFGASPNMFTDSRGNLIIGELQKAGVYHAVYADNMQSAWTQIVSGTCVPLCNAGSTASDGSSIYGMGGPGGHAFSLTKTGAYRWMTPDGSEAHYEPTSLANGVVYTVDIKGHLEAFDAATGVPLLQRPMSIDAGALVVAESSSGVAIARNMVYAAAAGYVIAYH